jgi:hypothetical protein
MGKIEILENCFYYAIRKGDKKTAEIYEKYINEYYQKKLNEIRIYKNKFNEMKPEKNENDYLSNFKNNNGNKSNFFKF